MSKGRIFIVHGHDEPTLDKVANFVRRINFDPMILREQPNGGRTIIEKFEYSVNVDYALILLTEDDEGCVKGGRPQPRARQNVILEFGFFIGRMGRKRVLALKDPNVEIPSDLSGLMYVDLDKSGEWKRSIARELDDVGLDVDWRLVGAA